MSMQIDQTSQRTLPELVVQAFRRVHDQLQELRDTSNKANEATHAAREEVKAAEKKRQDLNDALRARKAESTRAASTLLANSSALGKRRDMLAAHIGKSEDKLTNIRSELTTLLIPLDIESPKTTGFPYYGDMRYPEAEYDSNLDDPIPYGQGYGSDDESDPDVRLGTDEVFRSRKGPKKDDYGDTDVDDDDDDDNNNDDGRDDDSNTGGNNPGNSPYVDKDGRPVWVRSNPEYPHLYICPVIVDLGAGKAASERYAELQCDICLGNCSYGKSLSTDAEWFLGVKGLKAHRAQHKGVNNNAGTGTIKQRVALMVSNCTLRYHSREQILNMASERSKLPTSRWLDCPSRSLVSGMIKGVPKDCNAGPNRRANPDISAGQKRTNESGQGGGPAKRRR